VFNTIEEFLTDWTMETESTLKILSALTDEALKRKVYDEGRTAGFLAWHIVTSIGEMMNRTGLSVKSFDEESEPPASAKEIAETYKAVSDSLKEEIKTKWTDETLKAEVEMYGEKWANTITLAILIRHEIHHRAQLTVLIRQAGLKVPGVYGPAKEEWATMGMPPVK
jgi:uncharacterized damage-inducible protein DinB